MKSILFSLLFIALALCQTIPDGIPRLSGAGYVTTNCSNLVLGEEPPFPVGYIDEVNNYLYPAIRDLQNQRDVAGNYQRTFHFPTIGCVNATFNVLPNLPAQYTAGIFQPGAVYQAFVRFSGFNQPTQNSSDTRGLAIKLQNVPGTKLVPGFTNDTNFDFVFNAFPVFTHNNETVFSANVMSQTEDCGGGMKCNYFFNNAYPLRAADSAAEHANNTVASILTLPFFSISPFKFGDNALPSPAVKYRVYPCNGTQPPLNMTGPTPDYLTVDMTTRIGNASYCFLFQIQFQTNPCLHPINDFGVEWLETDTPYITVATLIIPQQLVHTDTDPVCKHAAMNVWRVTQEHRPLGSLNRARLFAMMNSQNQRLSLNNVIEPFVGLRVPGLQFLEPQELGINNNFAPASLKVNFPGNPIAYSLPDNTGPGATGLLNNGVPANTVTGATGAIKGESNALTVSFFFLVALILLVL